MKKLKTTIWIVMMISIVCEVIFLILAPDIVPVHYNFAGEVDRMGSKYETLIFPLITVGMVVFFLAMSHVGAKKGDKANEKMMLITGVSMGIFFTFLSLYFMDKALRFGSEGLRPPSVEDVNRFVNIGLGTLLVVLGNIMPKSRRNQMFGVRTKWSLANDEVWQKSQRFGGIATVIAGLCIILLSVVIPGIWNILVLTVVMIIWLSACTIASYRIYQRHSHSLPE